MTALREQIAKAGRVYRADGLRALTERTARSLLNTATKADRERRLRAVARADAAAARRKLPPGAKGLFIDCGSHLGQAFEWFEQAFRPDRFDALLIEPNPHCFAALRSIAAARGSGIELIDAAAGVSDGEALLYGLVEDHEGAVNEGASLLAHHNGARYRADAVRATPVRTFALSDLILAKAQAYPAIVLKLDIEASETPVLEHLLATGAAGRLDALYVAFHAQFMAADQRPQWRRARSPSRRNAAAATSPSATGGRARAPPPTAPR
jgi:FkbM family methyltransferase